MIWIGENGHFISGQQRIPCLLPTAITVSDEVHIEAQKGHLVETGSNHLGNFIMTFIYLVTYKLVDIRCAATLVFCS